MFATHYKEIVALLDTIDPIAYATTRNYSNGAVTKLSPYISRGVLSTRQVAVHLFKKGYEPYQIETFLKELAWRDYFQQVWMTLREKISDDIKQPQPGVKSTGMPKNILEAHTGILAIDEGIRALYDTGYLHNHIRMYVAAITCNTARSHWLLPAKWMYYYLLDADWASNALSWQWVAGSFSHKKYVANQENINKYCGTHQSNTFLNIGYDAFENLPVPPALEEVSEWGLQTTLPSAPPLFVNTHLPTYIYDFYNLDPTWNEGVPANRILLLEPSFFKKYPVCNRTIQFVMALAQNIPGIQVFTGEFQELPEQLFVNTVHYKEHPTKTHYRGTEHPRDWMFPQVSGYHPSFFNYWKHCGKYIPEIST